MLRSFRLLFRHLSLDHPRIDPVATRADALRLHLPEHASIDAGALLSHSGSRHFRIWKHPVNDSASGSMPAAPAASHISDRITKCPSDNAYSSWITPAGVSLRNCAGLVARRGS